MVYDENGQPAGEQTVRTASKPSLLSLKAWTQSTDEEPTKNAKSQYAKIYQHQKTTTLKADGEDLAFVTVSLRDAGGTLIPYASDQLKFEVTGAGTFRAVCNGDATSLEPFTEPTMKLFNGQLVVIVQAAKSPGTLTLKVTDRERKLSNKISLQVK